MPELATRMNWCAPRRAGVSLVALWAWTGWTTGSFPWRCSGGRPSFAGSVTRAGQLLPPDDEFLSAGPALQLDGQALAGKTMSEISARSGALRVLPDRKSTRLNSSHVA